MTENDIIHFTGLMKECSRKVDFEKPEDVCAFLERLQKLVAFLKAKEKDIVETLARGVLADVDVKVAEPISIPKGAKETVTRRVVAAARLLAACERWNEEDGFRYDALEGEQKGFTPTFYTDYSKGRVRVRSSKPVTSYPAPLPVVLSTAERAENFAETFIDDFNRLIL